jgi:hypothetical protein
MNRSSSTSSQPAQRRRRRLLLPGSVAAVTFAGIAFGGFGVSGAIHSLAAPQPTLPGNAAAAYAVDDAITRDFSRFALNALLATLLDDDEPPRWSDVALSHFCGPAAHVEVNGMPLAHGSRIPTTSFTVRWSMDQCTPLEGIELNGTVELLVFHEDSGLSAIVNPDRLIVSSAKGTSRMDAPFAASLSLMSTKDRP